MIFIATIATAFLWHYPMLEWVWCPTISIKA